MATSPPLLTAWFVVGPLSTSLRGKWGAVVIGGNDLCDCCQDPITLSQQLLLVKFDLFAPSFQVLLSVWRQLCPVSSDP